MQCNSTPLLAQSTKYLFLICIEQLFVISVFQLPRCFRSWQRRVEDEQFPSTFCSLFQRHHTGTFTTAGLTNPRSHTGGSEDTGHFLQAPHRETIHFQPRDLTEEAPKQTFWGAFSVRHCATGIKIQILKRDHIKGKCHLHLTSLEQKNSVHSHWCFTHFYKWVTVPPL